MQAIKNINNIDYQNDEKNWSPKFPAKHPEKMIFHAALKS